jgi:hypothetical protein
MNRNEHKIEPLKQMARKQRISDQQRVENKPAKKYAA